ncbi:MAG: HAMP domain-containing protein [Leptospiraceae bacterium]|nr:HAMP domain-containing protein [Leptospiraceae bacterium]MCP5496707.1 HAMP domain-containing protein [Leptospiraceae bacterium]
MKIVKNRPIPKDEFTPSKWNIELKLVTIISIILLMSISCIIALATFFFKRDSEIRIEEANMKLSEVIGLKVESDLDSIKDKLKFIATLLNKDFDPRKTDDFLQSFIQNENHFIYIGKFKKNDKGKEPVKFIYNHRYLTENKVKTAKVQSVLNLYSKEFLKSFDGTPKLLNISQGFSFPILAISVPQRNKEGHNDILIAFFSLKKLLNAFTTSGITEIFMVNQEGIILAHQDLNQVLLGTNLSTHPLIQKMVNSNVNNGQIHYSYKSKDYIGSYYKVGFADSGVLCVVPKKEAYEEVYNIQRRNIYIMLIVLFAAMLIVLYFSQTISSPILKLVDATKQIEMGNFDIKIQPTTRDEVGILTDSFIRMGHGLEERVKVKNILGSMVDPIVVQEAMIDLQALKQGTHKEITAFFSDVADFTAISEELSPSELAALLNEYLSAMTIILKIYDGVLDKYVGDAIVGIFNAPVEVPNHHLKAAKASLEMIEKLQELKDYWTFNNLYTKKAQSMDIRIGLNTGFAKVGFMGTDELASYTMMGDTVNVAARLETAGKDYGVKILISEETKKHIDKEIFTRELDMVQVKGKNKPVKIYEMISYHSQVPQNIIDATNIYEQAINLYKKKKWDKAIELFEKAIEVKGKRDKSSELLVDRCIYYKRSPPPPKWDGVFARKHK